MNFSRVANILGIVAGVVAGIACIVAAIMFKKPAFGVWGGVFIVSSVVAAIAGATASPGGSLDPSVKASFKFVPDWAMYVIFGLFAVGVVGTFLLPPWK